MKICIIASCFLALASATSSTLHYTIPTGLSYTRLASDQMGSIDYSISHRPAQAAPITAPIQVRSSSIVTPLAHSIATPLVRSEVAQPAAIATPVIATGAADKIQYHSQDELGQASYGHSELLQSHNAVQDAHGNKIGSFSYYSPDGNLISTNYVADALGYRVSSNALPSASIATATPLETPEVAAARIAHLKEHEIARSRTRRSLLTVAPLTYSLPIQPATIPLTYSTYPTTAIAPLVHAPLTTLSYRLR